MGSIFDKIKSMIGVKPKEVKADTEEQIKSMLENEVDGMGKAER